MVNIPTGGHCTSVVSQQRPRITNQAALIVIFDESR